MIDLYYAATPNGLKLRLFFEETDLPHRLVRVDLGKGEQRAPAFLAISPNGKIPAMVDHAPADGGPPLALFESGAMLLYLAEKTGRFLPRDPRLRLECRQWLFWQMAGLGPMAGQAGHFRAHAPEPVPYAIHRYTNEVERLYGVLDRRLEGRDFILGEYSVADMACYPWIAVHDGLGQQLDARPALKGWVDRIAARPATQCAYEGVESHYAKNRPAMSEAERRVLFGAPATDSSAEGDPR
ncbi:glutathione S-transferase N-terminal domain-containing protein [Amphiplicatus metriothermophilus]|uniref:GST-like protein n=1 Tax=Amphiplicatus metriothermophilus TaxID=1519374 RepID=A0A239PKA6_9PROT|nr:glutathione S-transferase N-terminal domain-containing protein [Amphiplicatus metriothermophilus]MBB5517599.1 GST-like protein [Amphiplicatus metriothermophilus]SNT68067.1 GST-like protein [Amphiplicatus metriothermophilus]